MNELQAVRHFKTELIDRYGKPPIEANNLLFKIVLKILAKKAGIAKLDLSDRQMHLQFSATHLKNTQALVEFIQSAPQSYELTPGQVLKIKLKHDHGSSHLRYAKNILKDIVQRVKN
jgi:transcription-repair coupling factor (superfamily II helicase)